MAEVSTPQAPRPPLGLGRGAALPGLTNNHRPDTFAKPIFRVV